MRYDSNLKPIADGNNDDGNGVAGTNGGSNSGSDSSAGSVVGTIDGSVGASPTSGKSDDDTRGVIDLSIGDVVVKERSKPASRGDEGTGTRRKRSNASDSGDSATAGNATGTEAGASSAGDSAPRSVGYRTLKGKSNAADVALTAEFVTEMWGIVFSGAALVTRDPEWKIEEDDANELGKRTIKLLKSLDGKSADKLEKRIAKYAPLLSFILCIVALVAPRIAHTRSLKRAVNLRKEETSRTGTGSAAAASATTSDSGMAGGSGSNGTGRHAERPVTVSVHSLRREDGARFFGEHDA